MLGSTFVKFFMLILKRQVNSSSSFASVFIVITHNSSVNFKLIHFLLWIKGHFESPNFQVLWWKFTVFLSFSKPQVKVFLQILHHSSVSWKRPPLYFFTSYTLHKHITYFECSSQNSPNFCHFASLFSVIDITPPYFFSWYFIYFQQKGPIEVQIW